MATKQRTYEIPNKSGGYTTVKAASKSEAVGKVPDSNLRTGKSNSISPTLPDPNARDSGSIPQMEKDIPVVPEPTTISQTGTAPQTGVTPSLPNEKIETPKLDQFNQIVPSNTTVSPPPLADQTSSRYQQAFDQTVSQNTPVPQTPGAARTAVNGMVSPPPTPSPINSFIQEDEYLNELVQARNDYQKEINRKKTLTEEYKALVKKSGIDELDTDLMNMRNVIEGTEDDIRNEVTKVGGFATDSQVMALANSRNKSLIKEYNNLLETRDNKQKYVDNLISLAKEDRQIADQEFDRLLDFDTRIQEYKDKAITNAQNSYDRIVDAVGYKGLYNAAVASGDSQAVNRINRTLGVDIASLAANEPAPELNTEVVDLGNQGKVLINSQTGEVISELGGAKGSPLVTGESTGNKFVTAPEVKSTIAQLSQMADLPATVRSQSGKAVAVLNKLQSLSEKYPDIFPGGALSGQLTKVMPDVLRTSEESSFVSDIAKLRQDLVTYITGAAYTSLQEEDVDQIIPQINRSTKRNREKSNELYNTIIGDIEAALIANGLNAELPRIQSLFKSENVSTLPPSLTSEDVNAMESLNPNK